MFTFLIGGYYGAGNLGDEAILECMLGELRALSKDIKFIVTSWNPELTSHQYDVQSIYWKDIAALIDVVQKSDLVILGGGGLFQDHWGVDPTTYLRTSQWDITAYGSLPLLARLNGIPAMIYSVGLGPLNSDIALQHTRLAFENSQVATLRDHDSFSLLCKSGYDLRDKTKAIPEVLADPVFSLTSLKKDDLQATEYLHEMQLDKPKELIGVVLRYWDFSGSHKEWLEKIADGLKLFLDAHDGFHAILIPFQCNAENIYTNDDMVIEEIVKLLNDPERIHKLPGQFSPSFTQALIKKCTLILGMRLHSLIMGINTGTPIIGLPYDPKVSTLMKDAGLDDYCCSSLNLDAVELSDKLGKGISNRDSIRLKMETFQAKSILAAKKNAKLALNLVQTTPRIPITFFQKFSLEQAKAILEQDRQIDQKSKETRQLCNEINSLNNMNEMLNTSLKKQLEDNHTFQEQLNAIYLSKSWRLVQFYYNTVNHSPLKYLYQLITNKKPSRISSGSDKEVRNFGGFLYGKTSGKVILSTVIKQLNSKRLKGIFILTSAFEFDRFYNQRVINLAIFLSKQGWGIIFVAWRWSKDEHIPNIGKEVYKNVFQIPVDVVLDNQDCFTALKYEQKILNLEFPSPEFLSFGLQLKTIDFRIVYDIIDDWEEFSKVGQASWFNKTIEEAIILNADYLTAVSQPLAKKFHDIRQDISIIPNGFDPHLLGQKNRNISNKDFVPNDVHIGYFGHLTESWFDWDFLFAVIDHGLQKGINIKFHLIGYGEPDVKKKINLYSENISLYGRVNPEKLYRYVKNWDLAMIPFKPGRLSEAVDPIKIYEYFYFGLPVIVTGIKHLEEYANVRAVSNAEEFIKAISSLKKRASPDPDLEKVIADSTWEKRFSILLEILESEKWIF